MGKIEFIKAIRTWASQNESVLSELKYLKAAKRLAERLHEEFISGVEVENKRLRSQADNLRLKLRLSNDEIERLNGGLTGMMEQQDESWPTVDDDPLCQLLNYAICIQNDLAGIDSSNMSEHYRKIHDHFQTLIVEINSTLRFWEENLANLSHISSSAASLTEFLQE